MKRNTYNKGQSTIEFLVVFPFIFLFIFFFLKVALNFTQGQLAHYATFMAGRNFLVFDDHTINDNTAMDSAQNVFRSILLEKINPSKFNANKLQFNSYADLTTSSGIHPLFKGVYFEYEETFSISQLLGGLDPMPLRSEALLGREPTRIGCLKRICKAMEQLNGTCDKDSGLVTLSDNGC